MPTLILASNDVDAYFSDLHALQSQKFRKQGSSPIGELSLTALRAILSPSQESELLKLDPAIFLDKKLAGLKEKTSPTFPCCGDHPGVRRKEILEDPWLREVGVVERWPMRTSRDVMSRRSNRPLHHEALYFPHRRLWITEYSCKVWYKPCRRRLIPRQHSRRERMYGGPPYYVHALRTEQ
ncbi:hypothetical protein Taro_033177 [Colocasia esculenta]|uniref:Uncharacterized protein n=1 Tax=Colocasia esculenta TaxID=4460 RepID=A0A843W8A1_COLES|nr:hypothetical protein [Colocasia esculenta]